MSVIATYLNDNAETPLGRFVAYTLYDELCNKYGEKSNPWSSYIKCIALASTVKGETNSIPSSVLLIPASSVRWQNFFYVHSCADKNGSREQNHATFRHDLSSLWEDLI